MRAISREPKSNDSGFTLLELTVSLALIALAVTVVAPRMTASRASMTLRAAAIDISSSLKTARAQARTSNRDTVFVVDTANRRYTADGAIKPKYIVRPIALTFAANASEVSSPSRGGFRFRPDGTASGGAITLTSGRDSATISVDWLTGAIVLKWR
ncbi:MAG: GspH/FimT family pseudopilin [Hyphomicrobium sp.]